MSFREAFVRREKQRIEDSINLPNRGVISTVIPDIESVHVDMAGVPGTPRMVVRHPYFGVNSWIRTMPEPGTSVITQRRGDLHKEEIWGYISNLLPGQVKRAKEEQSLIRRLNEGEIEIRSSGRAYAFFGGDGSLELRGGPIEMGLMPTRLEATSLAPTHKRRTMFHDPTLLDHQERFGVVSRPTLNNRDLAPAVQDYIRISPGGEFAHEYYRSINREDNTVVSVLHEGDVTNLFGTFENLPITNKKLRFKRLLGASNGTDILVVGVDEDLNVQLTNSANYNTETNLNFGTNNTLKLNTKTLRLTATNTGQLVFNTGLTIKSAQVNVASSNVTFGNTGSFAAVLGPPLVSGFLSPLSTALSSSLQILGADPALSPASRTSLTALSTTLTSLAQSLNNVLSTQVKLSG